MIDIKEIRVGNYFNLENEKEIVFADSILSLDKEILYSTINSKKYAFVGSSYLLPIKITEDLLLQLGFQKEVDEISKEGFYMHLPNGFRIDINKYSNTIGRDYGIHIDNLSCDSVLRGDIQYLHQLQNYIYDATKQELNIENIS